jgi:hypothetical protein
MSVLFSKLMLVPILFASISFAIPFLFTSLFVNYMYLIVNSKPTVVNYESVHFVQKNITLVN